MVDAIASLCISLGLMLLLLHAICYMAGAKKFVPNMIKGFFRSLGDMASSTVRGGFGVLGAILREGLFAIGRGCRWVVVSLWNKALGR
ncbi:hypothetical protein HQ571_04520 [Candidatus Kuenenbacteria bacterium]|nr:hypothetical protein [Candidatus Kuenenbacteria bacterium]